MVRRFLRRHPSIRLNVLIYQEGQEWIAHCLQMDLVTTGASERQVEREVIDLIKAQVIYAIENDNLGNVFRQAPAEDWAKLARATKCGTRRLRIDVPDRTREATIRPPIQEVELCVA